MERDHLIKQLKTLKTKRAGGLARQAWVGAVREVLMERAEKDCRSLKMQTAQSTKQLRLAFVMGRDWHRLMRPAVATFIVLALVFGGWITSVNASYNSLPGDMLYNLKIMTEHAQVALTSSKENKVKLSVEFAGRRLDEVAKLIEKQVPEKEKKVEKAVDNFKKDIKVAQQNLDEMKGKKAKSAEKVVEVVNIVDEKASQYKEALNQTVEKVPSTKKKVKEAKEAVTEVEVKAVEVLVEKHLSGEANISEQEVAQKIENKLNKAQDEITQAESQLSGLGISTSGTAELIDSEEAADETDGDVTETGEQGVEGVAAEGEGSSADTASEQINQAKEIIGEARTLLENKDYTAVIDRVKQVNTLAINVEDQVSEQTQISASASGTDEFIGVAEDGNTSASSTADVSTSSTLPVDEGLITGQSATSTDEIITQ